MVGENRGLIQGFEKAALFGAFIYSLNEVGVIPGLILKLQKK